MGQVGCRLVTDARRLPCCPEGVSGGQEDGQPDAGPPWASVGRSCGEAPRWEWSARHRLVRRPLASGPGGWRSSSLPR